MLQKWGWTVVTIIICALLTLGFAGTADVAFGTTNGTGPFWALLAGLMVVGGVGALVRNTLISRAALWGAVVAFLLAIFVFQLMFFDGRNYIFLLLMLLIPAVVNELRISSKRRSSPA